jgi:hypothetical protein
VRLSGDEEAALPGLLLLPRQEGVPNILFLFFSPLNQATNMIDFNIYYFWRIK